MTTPRPSWWSRNRWGIILLPVAIVAALAASSARVVLFWWPYGPHEVTRGVVGHPVEFTEGWIDLAGHHDRSLSLTITDVDQVSAMTSETRGTVEVTTPPGTVLWAVTMHVDADPDQVLWGCHLAVLDREGRSFDNDFGRGIEPSYQVKSPPCTPDGAIGPMPVLFEGQEQDPETINRPASYTTQAYVVTPADVRPTVVRLWWNYPSVVEVALTSQS